MAHGMYIPSYQENSSDDIDTICVYRFPEQYYLTMPGYHHSREMHEEKGRNEETDDVAYEIRKMFKMLQEINPNVISTLFLREEDFLSITPQWKYVMEHAHVFQSKVKIKNAFGGYAYSQLQKMTQEQKYLGYMGDKRKRLVDKHGYDTKNAAHLIRLLRMGIEYLTDGHPKVFRLDAEELLEIKTGKWKLDRLMKESDRLFSEFEIAYDKSTLPKDNNPQEINKILYEVMTYA
jgi:predicted nucleotidyltransferase